MTVDDLEMLQELLRNRSDGEAALEAVLAADASNENLANLGTAILTALSDNGIAGHSETIMLIQL